MAPPAGSASPQQRCYRDGDSHSGRRSAAADDDIDPPAADPSLSHARTQAADRRRSSSSAATHISGAAVGASQAAADRRRSATVPPFYRGHKQPPYRVIEAAYGRRSPLTGVHPELRYPHRPHRCSQSSVDDVTSAAFILRTVSSDDRVRHPHHISALRDPIRTISSPRRTSVGALSICFRRCTDSVSTSRRSPTARKGSQKKSTFRPFAAISPLSVLRSRSFDLASGSRIHQHPFASSHHACRRKWPRRRSPKTQTSISAARAAACDLIDAKAL